ncbi:hypothetical protein BC351_30095 [Paenibacillus ferrarius]|uniref:HTH cro/C1-type domain-containing protein n=1 Tax=Paenibacillus ferrarius TaxID=1469647 RepID=A0A1V4HGV6_9BACL|nr:helix-turn-helix transcriptional regulator [Paenibacillus ferrarius]OPH54974.1 hypothetical protein BC351_30095 [Paenibacillus ferrarius]
MNQTSEKEKLKWFGENLYNLRKDLKLTQEQLAGLINVKQSTVSEIENGQSNAKLTTIWSLVHVLSERHNSPLNVAEKLFKGRL